MNEVQKIGDIVMYEVPVFGYRMPLIVATGYALAGLYIVGATLFIIERNRRSAPRQACHPLPRGRRVAPECPPKIATA